MDFEDEKKLVEKARHDPEAFGKIFERYYEPVLHYVLRRVGHIQAAEDITSQIFFIVLEKLWQFRWRNIPFSAWLYRIAGNEIHYYYRKNKYRSISLEILLEEEKWEPSDSLDMEEELKEAEKVLEHHQDFLLIQEKLRMLPRKYQEVLALKFFEEKKIAEIACIVGKKQNTVKSLLKRGLELLRREIEHQKMMQLFPISSISEHEQP